MPAIAALPKVLSNPDGIALTFVIADACHFACPGCIVVQRKETRSSASLSVDDHLTFVRSVVAMRSVGLIGAQGYEPLHNNAWGTTEALMQLGRDMGIQTTLVTNGVELSRRLSDLMRLDVSGITVSLDSADQKLNDWSRGHVGAFELTMNGLRAIAISPLRERVLVASILRPGREKALDGMPALLASLGFNTWIVSAQLRFGKNSGGPVDDRDNIVRELLRLERIATAQDISMLVDDEFESIFVEQPGVIDFASARVRRLKRSAGVVRLAPDGSLSYGTDILTRVAADTVRWTPTTDPCDAINRAKLRSERK